MGHWRYMHLERQHLQNVSGPPGPNPLALSPNHSGLVKTPATPGNPYPIYWQPHADHTGNENGLMLLIDGIATPTVFFEAENG
jgi:hypothetical protein